MENDFTVLLYYQYCEIEDPVAISQWQENLCESLNLKGRIRVSSEGLNGTLGGTQTEVEAYILAFDQYPELSPSTIHWKVSKATTRYSLDDQRFQTLSCKVTKEVVSLDLAPAERERMIEAGPGRHLSPQQFHDVIASAAARKEQVKNGEMSTDTQDSPEQDTERGDVVLIDVRNIYETEIGKFECPAGIPVHDPKTRKFKEFKNFVDTNKHELRNKQVLMYCTGGVRCERASAYLRLSGVRDVSQLSGGIHSYQEAFPGGEGFFRGKNFVYDRRIAVPHRHLDEVVGHCRLCGVSYDDYKPQVRCCCCRMLQLVCSDCRAGAEGDSAVVVICELCESKGRGVTAS